MLLGFYTQLADALGARKAITEDFFLEELRAFLAKGKCIIFVFSHISHIIAFSGHSSKVIESTLDVLMKMLEKDEQTRRLSLTCLREVTSHREFLPRSRKSISQNLLGPWRDQIALQKILPRLKDDDVELQRLAILTIEQTMGLGRLLPIL